MMYSWFLFNIKSACEILFLEIEKVVPMALDYRLTRWTAGPVVLIQTVQTNGATGRERVYRGTT